MNGPFLAVRKDCDEAVRLVADQLLRSGFQVVQTFDLHAARGGRSLCACPHHGTAACDCQMVVLLVYDAGHREIKKSNFLNGSRNSISPLSKPASLVAHGHDGQTWFTLVDTPQQCPPAGLVAAIEAALTPATFLLEDDLSNVW